MLRSRFPVRRGRPGAQHGVRRRRRRRSSTEPTPSRPSGPTSTSRPARPRTCSGSEAPGHDPSALRHRAAVRSPAPDGTPVAGDRRPAPRHPARRHRARACSTATAPTRRWTSRSGTRRCRACSTAASSGCTRTSAAAARAAGAGGWTGGSSTSSTRSTTTSPSPTGSRDGLVDGDPDRDPRAAAPAGCSRARCSASARTGGGRCVAEVPFVDVVTTMFDASIPLTINEWDEWGDPRRKADFDWHARLLAVRQPAAGRRPARPAGHRRRARPAGDGARAGEVGGRAARRPTRSGRRAACSGASSGPARTSARPAGSGTWPTRPRSTPGSSTGSESTHERTCTTRSLRVARDLIRIDTSNAPARLLGRRPGNETAAAAYLRDYLSDAGVDCELVAREEHRANLVARLPGHRATRRRWRSSGTPTWCRSTRGTGRTRRSRRVVDDDGYLYGRGAVDMKNEVAARAVAMAELARTGFRPRGDLWFLAVADEEDGMADVGMRWLLEARPDIRPDVAINEGGGERLRARRRPDRGDRRRRREGHPARSGSTAVGEAGHASMPNVGDNAVPLLGRAAAPGRPRHARPRRRRPWLEATLCRCSGGRPTSTSAAAAAAPEPGRAAAGDDRDHDGADPARGLDQAERDARAGVGRAGLPDPARAPPRADVEARGAGPARRTASPTSWSWPEVLVAGSASPAGRRR